MVELGGQIGWKSIEIMPGRIRWLNWGGNPLRFCLVELVKLGGNPLRLCLVELGGNQLR